MCVAGGFWRGGTMKAGIYLGKEQIEIDRAEGEGCFLSEGQEDGHEMNGTNRNL